MTLAQFIIDPHTMDGVDIIAEINAVTAGAATISNAGIVSAVARPIAAGEISATELAAAAIKTKLQAESDADKLVANCLAATPNIAGSQIVAGGAADNLDAMADIDRGYVQTAPGAGEYKIIHIQRNATGKLEVDYDDVPV